MHDWQKRMKQQFDQMDKYNGHGGKARLARDLGIDPARMRVYFNKKVEQPRGDFIVRLADCLEVSVEWLEKGAREKKLVLRVAGKTGAGETWHAFDEDEQLLEEVEIDFDDEAPIAVEVDGDSMLPVYRSGDLLVGSRTRRNLHRKDCIVETVDGERLIKFVVKNEDGSYTLKSYNPKYADRENQILSRGYPIRLVIRS